MNGIILDIETIGSGDPEETKAENAKDIQAPAAIKKAETIADWHNGAGKYEGVKDALVEETFRKRSFDGGTGELISISGCTDGTVIVKTTDGNESDLINSFVDEINSSMIVPFFIGHNIKFDLEFLWKRCVILGIKPNFKLPFNGRHNSDFYCTMQAWAGYNKFISQDKLCKILGLPPKPDDINGANVYDHYLKGDLKRIGEYNAQDVDTVRAIYNKMNFGEV